MPSVVIGEQRGGEFSLLRRVECPPRQAGDIDVISGDVPIDFFNGNVICHPCLDPAIEADHDRFVRVIGIAGSKRFEFMQGMNIAKSPGNKRGERANRNQYTGNDQLAYSQTGS